VPDSQIICDPFMGAGTTGVAAMALQRKFIGIEIDETYFDVACRRIAEAWSQPRLFAEPIAKPVQPSMFD
jgi:DNA modification methylase